MWMSMSFICCSKRYQRWYQLYATLSILRVICNWRYVIINYITLLQTRARDLDSSHRWLFGTTTYCNPLHYRITTRHYKAGHAKDICMEFLLVIYSLLAFRENWNSKASTGIKLYRHYTYRLNLCNHMYINEQK